MALRDFHETLGEEAVLCGSGGNDPVSQLREMGPDAAARKIALDIVRRLGVPYGDVCGHVQKRLRNVFPRDSFPQIESVCLEVSGFVSSAWAQISGEA